MIDQATISVKAGNGGDGNISLITEFYRPRGGPDGGDGGKGGDVYVKATSSVNTLAYFRNEKEFSAENGERGGRNYRTGKGGEDLYIDVPVGTVIYSILDSGIEEFIADLSSDNSVQLVAKGGIPGYGNAHFKSSKNQTPRKATKGRVGENLTLRFELKLLSNVGFIGFPSVGKSSLLNYLSKNSFKTAAYPFTTLSPNLGVVNLGDKKSLVMADLPGLIEGASEGKGLGDDFLRHAERCGILVHILDISNTETFLAGREDYKLIAEDLISNYNVINKELENWNKNLIKKPQIVLLNKIDLISDKENLNTILNILKSHINNRTFAISSFTGEGVNLFVNYLNENYGSILEYSHKQIHKKSKSAEIEEITIDNIPNKRILRR